MRCTIHVETDAPRPDHAASEATATKKRRDIQEIAAQATTIGSGR